jgi:hydroxyacyl-ACP dehydratase HTD2-like protein with hotdog domain
MVVAGSLSLKFLNLQAAHFLDIGLTLLPNRGFGSFLNPSERDRLTVLGHPELVLSGSKSPMRNRRRTWGSARTRAASA